MNQEDTARELKEEESSDDDSASTDTETRIQLGYYVRSFRERRNTQRYFEQAVTSPLKGIVEAQLTSPSVPLLPSFKDLIRDVYAALIQSYRLYLETAYSLGCCPLAVLGEHNYKDAAKGSPAANPTHRETQLEQMRHSHSMLFFALGSAIKRMNRYVARFGEHPENAPSKHALEELVRVIEDVERELRTECCWARVGNYYMNWPVWVDGGLGQDYPIDDSVHD